MSIDEQLNRNAEPDTEISARGAAVRTLVIAAHENLVIAAGVEGALAGRLARDGD
jgi:acetate kinase